MLTVTRREGGSAGRLNAPPPGRGTGASAEARERRLARLAWLLDNAILLPGGYRVGLDGVIGLIPGVGDAVGAALSGYILLEAARLGASRSLLARMGLNVLIETAVGVVPLLGDLFDFAFKANARNVRLLEAHLAAPERTRRQSRTVNAMAMLLIGLTTLLVVWGLIALVRFVWRLLAG